MSHDIVEAAFLRRAGYKSWLVPDIAGSWEEVPSNVIDFAARDRRWAQGNLQHMGVMPMRGLHWLSRMHMLTGVLSYVSSPLWLLVLIITSIMTCMEAISGAQVFSGRHALVVSQLAAVSRRRDRGAAVDDGSGAVRAQDHGRLSDAAGPKLRAAFGGTSKFILSWLIEQT
jgi:membrane glycosyltransferase